jgi:hypothetical protein
VTKDRYVLCITCPNGPQSRQLTSGRPAAISPRQGCHLEQEAIQHTLPPKNLPQSDRHCLNLNITTPRVSLHYMSKLPVFIFIHGGGYASRFTHARGPSRLKLLITSKSLAYTTTGCREQVRSAVRKGNTIAVNDVTAKSEKWFHQC